MILARFFKPKYCLFAGSDYYPNGGVADFRGFGTIEELESLYRAKIASWVSEGSSAWGEIVEHHTMRAVKKLATNAPAQMTKYGCGWVKTTSVVNASPPKSWARLPA